MNTTWKDEKVKISKLNLDLQNPRLPKHIKDLNDASSVRNYLLKKEGVFKIARSIANNGYHRSAVAITCEENGKLVVLDGNRRLAACQLLLDPKLALDARDIKELEKLNSILDKKQLDSVKITIAPSRKEAEKEIWDIHVNQLLKTWQVLQKLRMYRNLIDSGEYTIESASFEYGISKAKFEKELSKLYFYEQILENLSKTEDEDELLKSGFNKIDRLILSVNGKKLLKYEVDDKGAVAVKNQKDFAAKIKSLVPFIVDSAKVNAQATQDELVSQVFNKIDPVSFPVIKVDLEEKGVPKSTVLISNEAKKVKKGTVAKKDWITNSEYLSYGGAEKVKQLFKEMKDMEPTSNKITAVISLRVLLESSLYFQLQSKKHISKIEKDYKNKIKIGNTERAKKGKPALLPKQNWSPSFREMLDYIMEESTLVIKDPLTRDALSGVIKGEKNFVEDLNKFIHNVHYIPKKDDAEKIWSQFGRLLFGIINKI